MLLHLLSLLLILMAPAKLFRDHTVLIAPSGPDHGSLLPGECPKAEAQLERVLSLQKKTIHTLTGPQMSIPSAEKYTPRQTWDLVQSATVPTYTTNNVTFQHTARFFAVRGDLLERAKDVYNRNTGAAIQYSEDIIFGSVGSFSYIHLDDAPALPVRVTVIRGEKRFAAWPFDPQTELPAALPYKGSRDRRGSLIDVTASNWERIDEYAAQHGGFSVVLKPGDWADIPSTWWHVALNTRPTISVNTSFLLQDDVAEVFYNTALLGYHGVHRSDLQLLHVNLGSGWVEMLRRACSKLFGAYAFGGSLAPPEAEPWKSTAAQQAAKGAFLYLVSQGMRVLQQMREGGAYTTSTTSLRFDGLNSAAVDSWIVWCNKCNGETSNTKRQRKHRAKE